MDRKNFLKLAGLGAAASVAPVSLFGGSHPGGPDAAADVNTCVLVPQETAGPYPTVLGQGVSLVRQDIREGQQGAYYTFKIRIMNQATCLPVANARVDVWHCNYQGNYSGYSTNSGHGNGQVNAVGQTWLRGTQLTDAEGYATFISVFPGWYMGRVWHIHFQVFLNSTTVATSQFTVPIAKKNEIYTTVAPYTAYGADPQAPSADNVFSDGYANQMATLEDDPAVAGGYISEFTASVNTRNITGLLKLEPETGGQFKLGQNFPNPHRGQTTVPFTLTQAADVTLTLWSLDGRPIAAIRRPALAAGDHAIGLDLARLGLPSGCGYYQLQIENGHGVYRQAKRMTGAR